MFTKKHLQNGDLVILRNGLIRRVHEDRLVGVQGMYELINYYNDDLTVQDYSDFDIMRVYRGNQKNKLIYSREQ